MLNYNYEAHFCRTCRAHPARVPTCSRCKGTAFEPVSRSQHMRMSYLIGFANQYDIAGNPDPLAVFAPGTANIDVWATPDDHPAGWEAVTRFMRKGAFSKPCDLVGSAIWVWEYDDEHDMSIIKGIGLTTEAFLLKNKRIVTPNEMIDRPGDMAWLRCKIEWLWNVTEVTWDCPPFLSWKEEEAANED